MAEQRWSASIFSLYFPSLCNNAVVLFKPLFFPNLAELLISFRIKPCNLSTACLLMIHDISCFVSFIGTMVPDDFAHLHVAYPVQGTSYHSRQQHILSAVSPYSVFVPAFHILLSLFYPTHLFFTISFFSCIKWHVKEEHDSERYFCSGQLWCKISSSHSPGPCPCSLLVRSLMFHLGQVSDTNRQTRHGCRSHLRPNQLSLHLYETFCQNILHETPFIYFFCSYHFTYPWIIFLFFLACFL